MNDHKTLEELKSKAFDLIRKRDTLEKKYRIDSQSLSKEIEETVKAIDEF